MKKKEVIIGIIIILVIGGYMFLNQKKVEIKEINYFEYYMNSGMMMYADERYILKKESNSYRITIKPMNEQESISFDGNKEFVKELESILKKHKVENWNGFHQTAKDVLDGSSFFLEIEMEDNNQISASGYMKWPKGYGETIKEIKELFKKEQDKNSTNS